MRELNKKYWHKVMVSTKNDLSELPTIQWLEEHIGQKHKDWFCTHGSSSSSYWFRDKPTATFFSLRWS